MRSFIVPILLMIAFSLSAQSLKVGEKLSYSVSYNEEKYGFSAKVQQLSPEIIFDYALTSENFATGTIKIRQKAQQSATKMRNRFSEEDKALTLQDEISVFPSQVMIDALGNGTQIKLDVGNGVKIFQKGKTKNLDIQFFTTENGALKQQLKTISAVELQSKEGKEHIWISKDLGQATIVEMELGWHIKLDAWISSLPLTDKPQDFLGKLISAPEIKSLNVRLANASYITMEDLSDPGKPYIDKEYFCPMEGIRLKTHNDSITTILFYTEGYEHESYKWRGYDGKFASGINLQMSYSEIDKTIGKPETPRWATDVMILYPQQKMIVYYNMPNDENDTKAIENAKIGFLEFQ